MYQEILRNYILADMDEVGGHFVYFSGQKGKLPLRKRLII